MNNKLCICICSISDSFRTNMLIDCLILLSSRPSDGDGQRG